MGPFVNPKLIYIPNLSLESSKKSLIVVVLVVLCKPISVFSYLNDGPYQKGLGNMPKELLSKNNLIFSKCNNHFFSKKTKNHRWQK